MSVYPLSVSAPSDFREMSSLVSISNANVMDRDVKKRRRSSHSDNDAIVNFNGANPQSKPKTAKKQAVSAANELRMLRVEVASMEEQLRNLKLKWSSTQPDERTLAAAAIQTEATRSELKRTLLEQQIFFAMLQSAVLRAPLHSIGKDIHEMLHISVVTRQTARRRSRRSAPGALRTGSYHHTIDHESPHRSGDQEGNRRER